MSNEAGGQDPGLAPIVGLMLYAEDRLQASLKSARELLEAGLHGPSFVWSVRSVEMFVKYFVLAPLYCPPDGDVDEWNAAIAKANKQFGSSNWLKVMHIVEEACGPLDPMLMEDGSDAYAYWKQEAVAHRGDVVHGRVDGDEEEAAVYVLGYAEQMIQQLKLRLIVSGAHPLSTIFRALFPDATQDQRGASDAAS